MFILYMYFCIYTCRCITNKTWCLFWQTGFSKVLLVTTEWVRLRYATFYLKYQKMFSFSADVPSWPVVLACTIDSNSYCHLVQSWRWFNWHTSLHCQWCMYMYHWQQQLLPLSSIDMTITVFILISFIEFLCTEWKNTCSLSGLSNFSVLYWGPRSFCSSGTNTITNKLQRRGHVC